jgi:hypothetical protein
VYTIIYTLGMSSNGNEILVNDFWENRHQQSFVETLPPGIPTLEIKTHTLPQDYKDTIAGMSGYTPLDYLRLLKFFSPQDRATMIQLGNWHRFAEKVSSIESSTTQTHIAQAACEALGEENTRNLALNFSSRYSSRSHQKAAIILTACLPLNDISEIYTQYANIARTGIEWPLEGDDAWIDLFYTGMHSLYICTMMNNENGIPTDEATKIIADILNQDMSTVATRITKPHEALRNVHMMERMRECMVDPDAMDKTMNIFGYKWQTYEQPERGFGGIRFGKYTQSS